MTFYIFITQNSTTMSNNIKVEMETFCDLLREYVFYNHQIIDRIDRNTHMIKNVSLISDTDSTIVSFDAFYHYTLEKIKGIDIEIGKYYTDGVIYMEDDENGNPTKVTIGILDESTGTKKYKEYDPR